MRAGERLAATEARLAAVDAHFADTRKRAAAAKRAFEDVKQKRHDLFMKAFTHISENIGGTYKDLTKSPQFPLGGQAYLDMEDSSEPYLAGLKYHAMPPLKRFRDMEHLSGGEKTIAALALLFAIHSYQPSPFFVLDEVDAALDSVNVGRVAQYVREHASPGMQFIVISLKATFFQESETLVGVMRDQTRMTSKYLSLDVSLLRPRDWNMVANERVVEKISAGSSYGGLSRGGEKRREVARGISHVLCLARLRSMVPNNFSPESARNSTSERIQTSLQSARS
jgi:structural maintenance of chromosome 1